MADTISPVGECHENDSVTPPAFPSPFVIGKGEPLGYVNDVYPTRHAVLFPAITSILARFARNRPPLWKRIISGTLSPERELAVKSDSYGWHAANDREACDHRAQARAPVGEMWHVEGMVNDSEAVVATGLYYYASANSAMVGTEDLPYALHDHRGYFIAYGFEVD